MFRRDSLYRTHGRCSSTQVARAQTRTCTNIFLKSETETLQTWQGQDCSYTRWKLPEQRCHKTSKPVTRKTFGRNAVLRSATQYAGFEPTEGVVAPNLALRRTEAHERSTDVAGCVSRCRRNGDICAPGNCTYTSYTHTHTLSGHIGCPSDALKDAERCSKKHPNIILQFTGVPCYDAESKEQRQPSENICL